MYRVHTVVHRLRDVVNPASSLSVLGLLIKFKRISLYSLIKLKVV